MWGLIIDKLLNDCNIKFSYLLYLLHDTFFPHLITFLGFDNLFPISGFQKQFQKRSLLKS